MASRRMRRVNEMVRQQVSQVILFGLSDPRLRLVTITRAEVSPDLRQARIFYSVLGSDADRRTMDRLLHDARRHLQSLLIKRLSMKHSPQLKFIFDESVAGSIAVSKLIDEAVASDQEGKPESAEDEPGTEEPEADEPQD